MNGRTNMNDNVQNVFELQTMLRRMSFISQNIKRINPDGIFGVETTEAVKSFQALKNLPVTGDVDFETWTELHISSDRS